MFKNTAYGEAMPRRRLMILFLQIHLHDISVDKACDRTYENIR